MKTFIYEETQAFYKRLDQAAKDGEQILIQAKRFPAKDSKLLKRLAKCKGFKEEMENAKTLGTLPPDVIMKIILAIAALLAGLFFYGVYKGYRIKFKFKKEGSSFEIEFELIPPP